MIFSLTIAHEVFISLDITQRTTPITHSPRLESGKSGAAEEMSISRGPNLNLSDGRFGGNVVLGRAYG